MLVCGSIVNTNGYIFQPTPPLPLLLNMSSPHMHISARETAVREMYRGIMGYMQLEHTRPLINSPAVKSSTEGNKLYAVQWDLSAKGHRHSHQIHVTLFSNRFYGLNIRRLFLSDLMRAIRAYPMCGLFNHPNPIIPHVDYGIMKQGLWNLNDGSVVVRGRVTTWLLSIMMEELGEEIWGSKRSSHSFILLCVLPIISSCEFWAWGVD